MASSNKDEKLQHWFNNIAQLKIVDYNDSVKIYYTALEILCVTVDLRTRTEKTT